MNIFVIENNVDGCAKSLCDKHLVKMILEYAQLLSTAHHILDPELDHSSIYRKTHINHPCTKWVIKSSSNYQWLFKLLVKCLLEYTRRYKKVHKTQSLLRYLKNTPRNIAIGGLTPFVQCMPDEYKGSDTVEAYRRYYNGAKVGIAKWKDGLVPNWFQKDFVEGI